MLVALLFYIVAWSASDVAWSFPAASTRESFVWSPSQVTLETVSQSYPDSIWRTLTSSEPRREFALEEVSLTLGSDHPRFMFYLVLGASSSGKSTILRLIRGTETPVAGTVQISCEDPAVHPAQPVYVDTRPTYGNHQSVGDILRQRLPRKEAAALSLETDDSRENAILVELLEILQLSKDAKISDLSTSEVYSCRLGEACLESMRLLDKAGAVDDADNAEGETNSSIETWPGPILLLDEWLDNETSTVVRKVESTINRLAARGALFICISHKPELFDLREYAKHTDDARKICRVTLHRGKVISVE